MTRLAIALTGLLLATSCADTATVGAPGPSVAVSSPLPSVPIPAATTAAAEPSTTPATASGPIVVIFFENHSYGQIIGNACCPYINAKASQGRLYSNYQAVTHPSLPNYLAVSGGSTCGKQGSDGVQPFCTGRNVWDQLKTAGLAWRVFQEAMPSRCRVSDSGQYVVRHNPEAIYADQAGTQVCAGHDVALPASFTALPPFTFVTPNMCNDMHDCAPSTGDRWLKAWLPKFLAIAGTRVVVTFDEGSSDNHVATFEVGAGVPNATNRTAFSHYSLLAGIEDALGLPRLGNAAHAIRLPI